MSPPTKVLQINPELFNIKSDKTIKHKEKRVKPAASTLKSPNILRKALLEKIRNFQKKEEGNKHKSDSASSDLNNSNNSKFRQSDDTDPDLKTAEKDFTTDFNRSLQYLQELSNKHKTTQKEGKQVHNTAISIKPRENKTIKKHHSRIGGGPVINLELPDELSESGPSEYSSPSLSNPQYQPPQPLQVHPQHQSLLQSQPVIITPINSTANTVLNLTVPSASGNIPVIIQPSNPSPHIQPVPEFQDDSNIRIPKPKSPYVGKNVSNMILAPINIKPDPPHGVLKGGNKPTFKQYYTIKNNKPIKPSVEIKDYEKTAEDSERTRLLEQFKSKYKKSNTTSYTNKNDQSQRTVTKIPVLKKIKTRTVKYNLGKKKEGKTVAILIKNAHTRKKIKEEHKELKRKPISEIKDYLRSKNMIKAGTLAPNDVLREMYEQTILSGDIINETDENLIHNFMSKI